MKKILSAILFVLVLSLLSITAQAFCIVKNETDNPNNQFTVRYSVEQNFNSKYSPGINLGTCATVGTDSKDSNVGIHQAILFQTQEWGSIDGVVIDINKVTLGVIGTKANGDLITEQDKTITFNNPEGNLVIGNWPKHLPDSSKSYAYEYPANYHVVVDDYGFVIIDAKTNFTDKKHPFVCGESKFGSPTSDVILRNLVINTHGIEKDDFFSQAPCLKDGGDVFVCSGNINEAKAPGSNGWCTASSDSGETDGDGDGYCEDANGDDKCDDGSKPGDCNDNDENVNPGEPEICGNGKDDDCNGTIDDSESCPESINPDADGDGYCAKNVAECPSGKKTGDCNDNDKSVHPGATEIPGDGKDQDCDNVDGACALNVSPESATIWAGDNKEYSVSYGTTGGYKGNATIYVNGLHSSITAEDAIVLNPGETKIIKVKTTVNTAEASYPLSFSTKKVVANNSRAGGINKGLGAKLLDYNVINATSRANSFDSIYDFAQRNQIYVNFGLLSTAECSDQVTLIVKEKNNDADGDGDPDDTDCAPNDAAIHHGATENCGDGVDNNCDGKVDSQDATCSNDGETDNDGDGYCEDSNADGKCNDDSHVGDCDDTNAAINPGAAEACDGKDNNCDGTIDNVDLDKDGYYACDTNNGSNKVDCDDNNANVNPGATELCSDKADNNCNGKIDEGCSGLPTEDNDGDGYCEATQCSDGSKPGDCDDTDASVNPGATEICGDNKDNDCDGKSDAFDPLCAVAPVPPGSIGWAANLEGGSCSLNAVTTHQNSLALMIGLAGMFATVLMLRCVKK